MKKTVRIFGLNVHTGMWKKEHIYHVYITTNQRHTVLYVGMTGRGLHRIKEHIDKVYPGFSKKNNLDKLVYLERFTEVLDAIAREKQLKKWSRKKKSGSLKNIILIGTTCF